MGTLPSTQTFQASRVALQPKRVLSHEHGDFIPLSLNSPQIRFDRQNPSVWAKSNRLRFVTGKLPWQGKEWELEDDRSLHLPISGGVRMDLVNLEEHLFNNLVQTSGYQDVTLKSCLEEGLLRTKTKDTPIFTMQGEHSSFEAMREVQSLRELEAVILVTGLYLQHDTREVHLCTKIEHLRWGLVTLNSSPVVTQEFTEPRQTKDEFKVVLSNFILFLLRTFKSSTQCHLALDDEPLQDWNALEEENVSPIYNMNGAKMQLEMVERLATLVEATQVETWLQTQRSEVELQEQYLNSTYQAQPQDEVGWCLMSEQQNTVMFLHILLNALENLSQVLHLDQMKLSKEEKKWLPLQEKYNERYFSSYAALAQQHLNGELRGVKGQLEYYTQHALMQLMGNNANWRIHADLLASPMHESIQPLMHSIKQLLDCQRDFNMDGRYLLDVWMDRIEHLTEREESPLVLKDKLWNKSFYQFKRSFQPWRKTWKNNARGLTHPKHRKSLVHVMKRAESVMSKRKDMKPLLSASHKSLQSLFKDYPEAKSCYDSVKGKSPLPAKHAPCPVCQRTRCFPLCAVPL